MIIKLKKNSIWLGFLVYALSWIKSYRIVGVDYLYDYICLGKDA
jgi:hypothetical protein